MWRSVVAVAFLASFGCGGSDPGHGGSDAQVDIDADPNAPDADPYAPDADPNAPDAEPGAPDADVPTLDGGAPTVCGGFGGFVCAPSEYCDWTPNSCGSADQSGVCRVRPDACPEIYNPVCGCDGMTYSNECFANAAGQDIIHEGMCP